MLRFSSKLTRARSVLAIIAALTAGIVIGLRATHSETIKQGHALRGREYTVRRGA
jgi:hypothetical protein